MTPGDVAIFVDADACPVKDEVFKVAERFAAHVYVVANAYLRLPRHPKIEMVLVAEGPDAADDWIAERAHAHSIVVTADIPLADRALKAGAKALSPKGNSFTSDKIGMALATRAIMQDVRSDIEMGRATGGPTGPAPFKAADRSRFLSALHNELTALARTR